MKKTMPKPVNWQDFESLCKKLWSDIWECPSIKKNGRAGQAQHGVDIYGIPKNCSKYHGIQCKGKDDYSSAELTETEVDEEIKKALTFKPDLEVLIFATTANKDAKIEEYIRIKNIENIKTNAFSIEIFSWEDIVDLIEESKSTYDWYLKDILHKENNGLLIEINGVSDCLELHPIFTKNIITVRNKPKPSLDRKMDNKIGRSFFNEYNLPHAVVARPIWHSKKINHSLSLIDIRFFNTGDVSIEHYRVIFEIENEHCKFKEYNH